MCERDARWDKATLKKAGENRHYADMPRVRQMHVNHRTTCLKRRASLCSAGRLHAGERVLAAFPACDEKRGLHLYGYDRSGAPKNPMDNGSPLLILRMETIADNVLLALFHGEIYQVMIEEPKPGFGSAYRLRIYLQVGLPAASICAPRRIARRWGSG